MKKQYSAPLIEVTMFGSDVIMQVFGSASTPSDQFSGGSAPGRRAVNLNAHRTPVF